MTKIHRRGLVGIIMLLLLVVAACGDGAPIDRFVQIPDRAWTYDFKPSFELHVADKNQVYRIFINFRHDTEYKYSNVFLLIHEESPAGESETKRVELTLAKPDGRWTGKNSGNIYTHRYLIAENQVFPDTGLYKFSIEQNMRDNPLEHVVAGGLRIEIVE